MGAQLVAVTLGQMKTLNDYFDNEMLSWLQENGLRYKLADIKFDKGELNILYNDKYCLKFYDRMGHGSSVKVNIADNYDESIYDNDKFAWSWVFEYLKLETNADTSSRLKDDYKNLIVDIKNIVPRLTAMNSSEWNTMERWIDKEARRRFG